MKITIRKQNNENIVLDSTEIRGIIFSNTEAILPTKTNQIILLTPYNNSIDIKADNLNSSIKTNYQFLHAEFKI